MSISLAFAARRFSAAFLAAIALLVSVNVASGDLLVADNFGNQILRYDPNTGSLISVLVSGGTGTQLSGPVGLRLDSNGDLLVTNQSDGRILKYNVNTGAYLGDFYSGGALVGPSDLQFRPDGSLYVATFVGEVSWFDSAGNFKGNYTQGGMLGGAASFAFNGSGELFVGDFASGDVLRYDASGNYVGVFASGLTNGINGASGLVFDADGDLWLSSLNTHEVFQLDATGSFKSKFSASLGSFTDTFPGPIMFNPGNPNELWVSLTGGGGVYKFSTDGTLLGTAAIGGGLLVPGQGLIVSAVPEPGSGLLLAGTAVFLCGLRRRRAG